MLRASLYGLACSNVMPRLDPRVSAEGKARGIDQADGTMDARIKSGHDSRIVGQVECFVGSPKPAVITGLDPVIHGR